MTALTRCFLERAINLHDVPKKITIDSSSANMAAIVSVQAGSGLAIGLRQSTHAHELIERDHRAVKRIVRPMLGFKCFWCAARLIAGIETTHMIGKGQLDSPGGRTLSAADPLYSLAF